jgi:hypothetical protein
MSFFIVARQPDAALARRAFLGRSGVMLSGAAVALLAGRDALAAGEPSTASDVSVLNTALGAELEAIAAYQLGPRAVFCKSPCSTSP